MKPPFSGHRLALAIALLLPGVLSTPRARATTAPPSPYLYSYAVTSNTPVPDRPGTTFAINGGSPGPAIDGNYLAFMETNGVSVLWSLNTVTGVFTRLADTTTTVPGGTSQFDSFNSFELFNGVVVFSAAGTSDPRGLFSVPVTGGAITKLIDLNTPVPNGTGTLAFDSNEGPYYRINDGGVLFGANTGAYIVPAAGGTVTRIADRSNSPLGYYPLFGDESAGLTALLTANGDVFGDTFLYAVPTTGVTLNPANFTLIAGEGTAVPGSTTGNTFGSQVGVDMRVEKGTVVFTGQSNNNLRGIYSSVNGVLSTLVDNNTSVPLAGGGFINPNNTTILPDTNALSLRDGEIAFEAKDDNGNNGIYTEPSTGGAITQLYDEGNLDPVDGTSAGGITLGSYATSAGKVAFLFTQEFGLTYMVIATPKPNISPTVGGDTGVVTITISGKNFAAGATVTLSAAGRPTLTADIVTPASTGTSLAALFDLVGRPDALYDLTITNADGSVLTYPASFTIEPGSGPQLYADVIGRNQARGGYFQTYTVLCGNSGDTDAYAVPLVLTVPSYITLQPGNFAVYTPGTPEGSTPPPFTKVPAGDKAYTRARLVLPRVPAGQYVTLTVQLKAPVAPQYAHKVFTFSAVPLRGLVKPTGPVLGFEPQPPVSALSPDPLITLYPLLKKIVLGYIAPTTTVVVYIPILPDDGDDDGGGDDDDNEDEGGYPFDPPDAVLPPTGGSQSPEIIVPGDPNDKTGSLGVGAAHFLSAGQPLRYSIQFENEPTASASARTISITDQLDPAKVDLSTFAFGPIAFGATVMTPPPGQNQYTTTVDLRPANDLLVQVSATLNVTTGLLTYTLASLDPATGLPPTDPTAGFLPPDINPPAGEGFVFYTVSPLAALPSGTAITNQASVVFDVNAAILTPIWSNTLDTAIPISKLRKLPKITHSSAITLHLSGSDHGGSGIGAYNLYVSDDGKPYTQALSNVAGKTAVFNGTTGHTYRFFSQAESKVFNLEPLKDAAETTTNVMGPDLIGAFKGAVTFKRVGPEVEFDAHLVVTNQSPTKATNASSMVRFYVSKKANIDGAKPLGEAAFGVLAPGATETVKLTDAKVLEAAGAKGKYVIAVIDPDNAVTETNKQNNTIIYGPLK
jgi:hypothetical protein